MTGSAFMTGPEILEVSAGRPKASSGPDDSRARAPGPAAEMPDVDVPDVDVPEGARPAVSASPEESLVAPAIQPLDDGRPKEQVERERERAMADVTQADIALPSGIPAVGWARAAGWLGAFILAILAWELGGFLQQVVQQGDWMGGVVVALGLGTLLAAVLAVRRELKEIHRLQQTSQLSERLQVLVEKKDSVALTRLLVHLTRRYSVPGGPVLVDFKENCRQAQTVDEVLKAFVDIVQGPVDRAARQAIRVEMAATALAVAASPLAWLDAFFIVWRSMVLVRRVAILYGFRPGPLATLYLARQALTTVAMVTALEAGEPALDAVMKELLGFQAARWLTPVLEGNVILYRLHRFGSAVIAACRPDVRARGLGA